MKAVRLTFKKNDDIFCRIVSMYFRMTGIYATERCIYEKEGEITYQNVKLNNCIKELGKEDYKQYYEEYFANDGDNTKNQYKYDAEIFFVSDIRYVIMQDEQEQIKKIFFCAFENKKDENKVYENLRAKYGEKYIIFVKQGNEKECIRQLLGKMYNLNIIDDTEFKDLDLVLQAYMDNNYFDILMKSKYFFKLDWLYEKNCKQYLEVINEITNKLKKEGLRKRGDEKFRHLQYALAEVAYQLDLYCRQNERLYIYNVNDIIYIINKLDESCSQEFGNLTKCLLGQIYYNLQERPNTSYEYYLECCKNDESLYNAYLFREKGRYWQDFIGDYERANQYYFKSIIIYPEYFSSWYKMGFCYYQCNNKKKALYCFERVIDIFDNYNIEDTLFAAKDIEHLFLSKVQCAKIVYEVNADVESAIKYDLDAIELWKSISNNKYLEKISEQQECERLKMEVQKNLDISKVKSHLRQMYKLNNQYDEAEKYQ